MNNPEAYIDKTLDDIINDAKKSYEFNKREARNKHFKNFYMFYPGERVSMTLSAIAIDTIYLEETQRIEAILVNPEFALIDVKLTDGLEEWEGKTIGLGVCTDQPREGVVRAFSRVISGNGEVAYYMPEDLEKNRFGKPFVNDDKLRHLALKYVKVTVGGVPLIDFTNK